MMKIVEYPGVLLTVLLTVNVLAGCLAGGDGSSLPTNSEFVTEPVTRIEIEHEKGTAQYGRARSLQSDVWMTCGALGTTVGDICRDEIYPHTSSLPSTEEPDPAVDITGATFAETSKDFIATIEIAELREEWDHVEPDVYLEYGVSWEAGHGQNATFGEFGVEVANNNGEISFFPTFYAIDEGCNDWWVCWHQITYEIEYGAPGTIQMMVPRTIIPDAMEGNELNVTEVSVHHLRGPKAQVTWGLQEGPVDEKGYLNQPHWENYAADRWVGEERFTFRTPQQPVEEEEYGPFAFETNQGNAFDMTGDYRPETDMLEIELDETETTFTLSVQVASVQETPGDHFLWLLLGAPSGRVIEAGFDVVDGERIAYSGYHSLSEWQWNDIPVAFEAEPGEPGTLKLTWTRSDIGNPQKGDSLSLAWVMMFGNDIYEDQHEAGPLDLYVRDRTGGFYRTEDSPPFWFGMDTAPATEEPLGIVIKSETGGTRMPPTLPHEDVNEDQYDITYVEATGRDESTFQVSLGIQDLTRVEIPTGYEAVAYAVGLQTETGNFKVFYYKDEDHQDYYCAPDTLVLADGTEDPNGVVWTRITGLLSRGGRGPVGNGGPSSGAITFQVPHECLGLEEGVPFQVYDFAAGTYLLEDPASLQQLAQVHTVDTANSSPEDLPVLLGVEPIPDNKNLKSAWYTAPLGLNGQDWDVLGVAIALMLATGGAFVVYRRRRNLRRYLNRVSHTAKIQDLNARETGLGELREALRTDLVGGKIADHHYTIVLRHIEEAMKDVRVKSIENTFRELPFHVVSKLRSVLDDGVITQDEREMVVDLVERAEIPANEKQKVLSRLDRWQLVDEVAGT